jgi:hypothetical protein
VLYFPTISAGTRRAPLAVIAMKHITSALSRDNLYVALVVLLAASTWGMMLFLAARAY